MLKRKLAGLLLAFMTATTPAIADNPEDKNTNLPRPHRYRVTYYANGITETISPLIDLDMLTNKYRYVSTDIDGNLISSDGSINHTASTAEISPRTPDGFVNINLVIPALHAFHQFSFPCPKNQESNDSDDDALNKERTNLLNQIVDNNAPTEQVKKAINAILTLRGAIITIPHACTASFSPQ